MLSHDDNMPNGAAISVESLIILDGVLHGKEVRVVKEDRCNTNSASLQFPESSRKLLEIAKVRIFVNCSEECTSEEASELIISKRKK